jgi:hypothetical protein
MRRWSRFFAINSDEPNDLIGPAPMSSDSGKGGRPVGAMYKWHWLCKVEMTPRGRS